MPSDRKRHSNAQHTHTQTHTRTRFFPLSDDFVSCATETDLHLNQIHTRQGDPGLFQQLYQLLCRLLSWLLCRLCCAATLECQLWTDGGDSLVLSHHQQDHLLTLSSVNGSAVEWMDGCSDHATSCSDTQQRYKVVFWNGEKLNRRGFQSKKH